MQRSRVVFDESAEWYDAFYDALGKNYRSEARTVLRLARAAGGPAKPRTLLDVACGTGRHIEAFRARGLECTGVDISPQLLRVARRRNPGVDFVRADMLDLDLRGRRFDVVTCLFSSIAYLGTTAKLRRAVRRLAAHAEPGGVVAVEPWFQPEEWILGEVHTLTAEGAIRMSISDRRRDVSVLEFHYLLPDRARRAIRHAIERHELRLFRWDDYEDAFRGAGLTYEVDDYGLFGRGLILGRVPPAGSG